MTAELSGRCLCGGVSFECSEKPSLSAHCACVDCRKSSGTSHSTHVVTTEAAFSLSGEVQGYEHAADSGHLVTRFFCRTCGCPVYSTNSAMPGMVFLRASALDDQNAVTPAMLVYASRAPAWAGVGDGLVSFAEMPEQSPEEIISEASGS
jgi:hypothetical protein